MDELNDGRTHEDALHMCDDMMAALKAAIDAKLEKQAPGAAARPPSQEF